MQIENNETTNVTIIAKRSKKPQKYERFGEIIRHFTLEELQQLFDSIDNYKHKLMFEVIYELGCRVGEFVKIQVKQINFNRSTVFFPAENTKTKHARISYLPQGLTNEIKSMLKQRGVISKRDNKIKNAEVYIFHPGRRWNKPYTPNRIRQIFQKYVSKAGLQQVYGKDTLGRSLKMFTPHCLRHSHIYSYIVDKKISLPIVQRQVGHTSLKTTSVYLQPSTEEMAAAYNKVRNKKVE